MGIEGRGGSFVRTERNTQNEGTRGEEQDIGEGEL